MKKASILICIIFAATLAFAAKPELPTDGSGVKIHDFAPTGQKSVALTVNSQTVNASDDLRYSIYSPTACIFRMMTTATKSGIRHTLPANAVTARAVNPATPFLNFSGCTSGELQRQ